MSKLKYFSMFSGIGGFELGIDKAILSKQRQEKLDSLSSNGNSTNFNGSTTSKKKQDIPCFDQESMDCVGFSEIDKYAIQIYKKHFPNHKEYGDVSNITWPDVEDFEMVVGGFPCQAFSIAGKRKGFNDTRGTLFFEIARCLREKQPRFLLLENVKGLLSHEKGKTFGTILSTLDELGYDLQWQVLNSKNFGVPQNRERVFIVGHLRGGCRPEVFPIRENDCKVEERPNQEFQQIACACRARDYANWKGNFVGSLTGGGHSGGLHSDMNGIEEPEGIRRLTPMECERLQGFPDNWTEGISNTQRYKCLGNAVTVNVIEAIMSKFWTQRDGDE